MIKDETTHAAMRVFPVFRVNPIPPLKIGILTDVLAGPLPEGVTRTKVRLFLSGVCRDKLYRSRFRAGAPRYGLDGEPCGAVTEQEYEQARSEMNQHAQHRREVFLGARKAEKAAAKAAKKAAAQAARLKPGKPRPQQSPHSADAIPVRRRGRSWSKDAPL